MAVLPAGAAAVGRAEPRRLTGRAVGLACRCGGLAWRRTCRRPGSSAERSCRTRRIFSRWVWRAAGGAGRRRRAGRYGAGSGARPWRSARPGAVAARCFRRWSGRCCLAAADAARWTGLRLATVLRTADHAVSRRDFILPLFGERADPQGGRRVLGRLATAMECCSRCLDAGVDRRAAAGRRVAASLSRRPPCGGDDGCATRRRPGGSRPSVTVTLSAFVTADDPRFPSAATETPWTAARRHRPVMPSRPDHAFCRGECRWRLVVPAIDQSPPMVRSAVK